MEAGISNQIIRKYRNDQQQIKDSRYTYLQRKSLVKGEQIKQNEKAKRKKSESLSRIKEHSKTVKRFRIILDGMENGWCSQLKPDP
jgi:hypothetical protein